MNVNTLTLPNSLSSVLKSCLFAGVFGISGVSLSQADMLYYMPFEDGANFYDNDGTQGGTGTPSGSPTVSTSNVPSGIGSTSSIYYASNSRNVTLPNSTNVLRQDTSGDTMTVSTWFYLDSSSAAWVDFLQTNATSGWQMSLSGGTGSNSLKLRMTANGVGRYSEEAFPLQTWVQMVLTWDTSVGYQAFLNGTASGFAQNNAFSASSVTDAIQLRGGQAPIYFDDLAIWDTVLTDGQSRSLSQAPASLDGYNAGVMDQLFQEWELAGSGASVDVDGTTWSYAEDFDTTGHNVGDVWQSGNEYYMWFDGDSGSATGVFAAVPEPEQSAAMLGGLFLLIGLMCRRFKRSKQ